MKTRLAWIWIAWMGAASCVPEGQITVKPGRDGSDQFSVQGMTEAILEIEATLGTERIRPLRLRYEKAYKVDPKNPFKRFLWAYSLDDRNEAWAELTKVTKLNDRFYWAYLGMAMILDGWKVDDQAVMKFKKALELGSSVALGHGRLGRLYLRKGDTEKALPLIERAVDMEPKRVAYRIDLARVLVRKGSDKDARATYQKVLELDPKSFTAASELAALIQKSGDKAAAVDAYARAAELQPDAFEVQFARAKLLAELERHDEALPAMEAACKLKPGALLCWQALAKLAGELDKPDVHKAAFEEVTRLDPENIAANKYLGPVYLKAGEIEKALPAFQVVYAKENKNVEILSGLATIYEEGEEFSRAIEFNQKIIDLQADHAGAKEAQGRLFERFHIVRARFTGKKPDDVFARNREQIAKVYKQLLKEHPGLSGELHLKVTVQNDGSVTEVTMVKNTLANQVIDLCAYWNLRRSGFPSGFGATYDFELTLKPGE